MKGLSKLALLASILMFTATAMAQEPAAESTANTEAAPAVVAPAQDAVKAAPAAPAAKAMSEVDLLLAQGPMALLEEADRRHNPFDDQIILTRMVLNGGVHKDVTYLFHTYTKGENRRAVRFHEPAEMKGMGVVIKGRDEVYARLPDSDKVRRVGTHAKRQSFYGSDWSMDDMSMIFFAKDFSAKLLDAKSDNTHVKLELTKNAGVDLPYNKLVIKIDRKLILIDYIEYYDDNNKYVKLQQRYAPKVMGGGYLMYTHLKLTDIKTKHQTENFVEEEKINQKISDDTFSKRWLVRSL
ncbi:MAG: outer membrane lipoprotein-sorting protein [Bradymonadales bacterium]|jgi:hypothetical protein